MHALPVMRNILALSEGTDVATEETSRNNWITMDFLFCFSRDSFNAYLGIFVCTVDFLSAS